MATATVVPFVRRRPLPERKLRKFHEPSREVLFEWLNEQWGGDLSAATKAEYFGKETSIVRVA